MGSTNNLSASSSSAPQAQPVGQTTEQIKLMPVPSDLRNAKSYLQHQVLGTTPTARNKCCSGKASPSLGCLDKWCGVAQAGVHPEQPGRSVSREGFESLWRHSVLLLQRGFKTGSILTVDDDEAKKLGKPWTRRCDLHFGSTQLCWHGGRAT